MCPGLLYWCERCNGHHGEKRYRSQPDNAHAGRVAHLEDLRLPRFVVQLAAVGDIEEQLRERSVGICNVAQCECDKVLSVDFVTKSPPENKQKASLATQFNPLPVSKLILGIF